MRAFTFLSAVLIAGSTLADGGDIATPDTERAQGLTEMTGSQKGFILWLRDFRSRALVAGISADIFDRAFQGATYLPDVIDRDRHQNEFTKTIWDYLDKAVSEDRISAGQKVLKQYKAVLDQIEVTYGVEREIVVAIWGLESAYGAVRGNVPTLSALATLAYDKRRAAFFESELIEALHILQDGHVVPEKMLGSWAGAMGHTQFMPSSWKIYAVDFDGNGRKDIWGDDPTDALASTASYLAGWGWVKGQLWGLEVTLPSGFDYLQSGDQVTMPVAEWQAMGVRTAKGDDLPDHGAASVLLPGGVHGAAFLIFQNFHVIEHYNPADAYVIAIGYLADRIKGGARITAEWPREKRALSQSERLELQRRLTAIGFDTGGIDSKMGPKTIAAVKNFQKQAGLIPDGFPDLPILQKLRTRSGNNCANQGCKDAPC